MMKKDVKSFVSGDSKRKFLIMIFCCLIILFTFSTTTREAAAYDISSTETQLTTDLSDQFDPSISGTKIVYSDLRNKDADIYIYDIDSETEIRIDMPGDQLLNDISGNLVVFTDYGTGNSEILVYNWFTNAALRNITNHSASQRNPAISGNLIVYEDSRNGNSDIYLYNLATDTETRLTDDDAHQINPAISGNIVVWEDWRNDNGDIYMFDLLIGNETQITNDTNQDMEPDVDGDIIAFTSKRDSPGDVYYYRISTGDMVAVTNNSEYQRNPAVSGNYIAYEDWTDEVNGNINISVYSIPLAASECVIDAVSHQYWHDISGNRIVYTDLRNDNCDLYLSEFSFHDVAIEVSPLTYDFGEVEIDAFSSFIVSISNVGVTGFLACNVYFEEGSNPNFTTAVPPMIPILVDAGQTFDVEVTFTPSNIGSVTGTLFITSTDPDESLIGVSLTGAGVSVEIPPSQKINDILTFIDESVETGTLVGTGPGNSALNRVKALKNMIESTGNLIESGDLVKACEQLYNIYLKMDGFAPPISPPDFVDGIAREELAKMVLELMQDIGCGSL